MEKGYVATRLNYIIFQTFSQVENIAVALGSEFKIYLPQLIPQILRILMHDTRYITETL